jgi:ABC-2 type transport system permease protein
MRAALRAEWSKQRSIASTWRALVATVVATVGGGAAMAALVHTDTADDFARWALAGAMLGQAAVAALGAAALGDEYGSGLILVTLTAVPRRDFLLAAKATVLAATVLTTGVLAAVVSLLAATSTSRDAPDLTASTAIRAVLAISVYLALIALLALGTAAVSRSTATATALTLALLYLPPLLAALIADPAWQLGIQHFTPMSAGLAPPIGAGAERHQPASWSGLGIVALWAAAALAAGRQALRIHDI